jgi:16S rRNA C967 or C1407 C5-methylase (RsmB/RsmF family)/NOL1/NOP2/fmu family ribosome biogenesis protein
MLPKDFFLQISEYLPEEEITTFCETLQEPPITSLRLNPKKNIEINYRKQPVPWSDLGFYLEQRPSFTQDPLFWAGAYYVQEASSMFLEQILSFIQIPESAVVLDLCASPGGKSTHLLSLLPKSSLLVSNEIIRNRADILQENLCRWGYSNYIITQSEASVWSNLENFFDVILVDAPCSGEGMFRKEKQALAEWSLENVKFCAARQKDILQNILPALAEGGYLIYSTCTYNTKENEENVRWLVEYFGLEYIEIPIKETWGIRKSDYGYRFFPHLLQGEGFFIACLRKKGQKKVRKAKKNLFTLAPQKDSKNFEPWLKNYSGKEIFTYQEKYLLLYPLHSEYISQIAQTTYIKHTALELGTFKQKDFVPTHDLAMSEHLHSQVPAVFLDKESALCYLSKKDFSVSENLTKGWNIVKYKHLALGWVKVLGNRINNYYPTEIRIRQT